MRLLVTRPAVQARTWTRRLREHGVDAHALPLIAIEAAADLAPVHAAWGALSHADLAMFVSPNAVSAFFAARPAAAAWPERLRAAATGPGTLQALIDAGVPAERCVAPQTSPYDSARLWLRLRDEDWREREVWIVRGDGGRDEFAQTLTAAGARVNFVSAYRRAAPRWSAEEAALAAQALAQPRDHAWWLSSGEAIDHLATLLPNARWNDAQAIASHPRIAERARVLGMGRIVEAPPEIEAVIAGIASLESMSP